MAVSFVVMRRLLVGFWMGAGHQKDQVMIRRLEFSGPGPIFQKGAGKGIPDCSCLCDEASIKLPRAQHSASFWVAEHRKALGERDREGPGAPWPIPHTLPCASLPSRCSRAFFIISFGNKQVNNK